MKQILLLLASVSLTTSCQAVKNIPIDKSESIRNIEQGIASWYGLNFHGKKTANGEIYDMNELTAAHKTLPFNSLVKVINTENSLHVTVRINDRGPYVNNRIIDISKKAAEALQMIQSGTATVELILIKTDREITPELSVPHYSIQEGSFSNRSIALRKQNSIQNSRIEEVEINREKIYQVYVGLFTDPEQAEILKKELIQNQINGFVKQIEN